MLRLTQEWLGNEDPDLRRASTTSDDFGQALRDIMRSLFRHLVPRLRSVELQRWRHAASLLRRSRPSGRRLVEGD